MSDNLIKREQSPSTIRFLGGVLIVIGGILVGMMAAIVLWINSIIAESGKPGATTTWKADPGQMQITFLLLGLIAAFGFSSILAGAIQVITGKRSKTMVVLMLVLCVILVILAWWVKRYF